MATSEVLRLLLVMASLGASGVLACGFRKESNSPKSRPQETDHPFLNLSLKIHDSDSYVNAEMRFKETSTFESLLTLLYGCLPMMEGNEGDIQGNNSSFWSAYYPKKTQFSLRLGSGSSKVTMGNKTFERNTGLNVQLDEIIWLQKKNETISLVQNFESDGEEMKCECKAPKAIKQDLSGPQIFLIILLLLSLSANAFFAYQKLRKSCHPWNTKIFHLTTQRNSNDVPVSGLGTTETREEEEEEEYAETENTLYYETKKTRDTPEGAPPEGLDFVQNANYRLTPELQRNREHEMNDPGGYYQNHHDYFRNVTRQAGAQPNATMTSNNLRVPSY